ncbi:hypothetical protein PoB_006197600 [Plakobranchus ocellatus]|uniref:Uncharacterized protein n=1 Tax=Plakobranchus ocellatus TaxID=259542 RepID=A0AAV4CU74_9GAST|nr:hypothetical protein PoB_006197600 [Plakobranchus ocellatus]
MKSLQAKIKSKSCRFDTPSPQLNTTLTQYLYFAADAAANAAAAAVTAAAADDDDDDDDDDAPAAAAVVAVDSGRLSAFDLNVDDQCHSRVGFKSFFSKCPSGTDIGDHGSPLKPVLS